MLCANWRKIEPYTFMVHLTLFLLLIEYTLFSRVLFEITNCSSYIYM